MEPRHEAEAPPGRLLLALVVLVALQGVALMAVALTYLVELAVDGADDPSAAVIILVLALLGGVGLLAVARGFWRRRRWGRSPVLVTQLIVVPLAIAAVPEAPYVGLPLLAWATLIMVLLFVPAVADRMDR